MLMVDPTGQILERALDLHRRRGLFPEGGRIIAGVSGGADSSCMLHVLLTLREQLLFDVVVAHLNHGVRGAESDADAAFVESIAKKYGVEFISDKLTQKDMQYARRRSPEAAWRELRCKFLHDAARAKKAARVALGHNADDQAETILLRLIRGSSPTGILGMDSIYGMVIRPLLTTTRKEIEQYCEIHKLEFRNDSSNNDLRFPRNRVRHKLIPFLSEEFNPRARENIFRFSDMLRADIDFVETMADAALAEAMIVRTEEKIVLRSESLSLQTPLLTRVLRNAALRLLGTDGWRLDASHIEAMSNIVKTPGAGKVAVLPCSIRMVKKYETIEIWRQTVVETKDVDENELIESAVLIHEGVSVPEGFPVEFEMSLIDNDGETDIFKNSDLNTAFFDRSKLGESLIVRYWEKGDTFQPLGMNGAKKLSDFFIDGQIDRSARSKVPLLLNGNDIIWVVGHRSSHQFRVTEETKTILKISAKTINN